MSGRLLTPLGGALLLVVSLFGAGVLLLVTQNEPAESGTCLTTTQIGLLVFGLGTMMGTALLLTILAYRFRQMTIKRLRSLQKGLEKFGQGDFSFRLQDQGQDELGQVVATYNELVAFLQAGHEETAACLTGLTTELNQCKQEQATLARAYDAQQRQNQLLVEILGIGHLLQRNLNPSSLFQEIVQTIHHSLGFEVVVLSLLDEANHELRPRAYVGLADENRQLFEQAVYTWEDFAILLQERFRIGRCYFFPHDGVVPSLALVGSGPSKLKAGSNGGYRDNRWHPDDALLVSIELRPGQIVGIISLGQPTDGRRPDLETLQALEVFASQTATAVENARLYEQIQRDLVERRRAAQELQRLNEKLEDRVKERTAELAQANETLQAQILERQRAEEQIRASLKEKELLLQEIHHRVKNNLQVISSLLNLQADYIESQEIRDIFRDSQNRVRSMALVHEKLYRSADLARVDLAEYIRNLANFLFSSYQATADRITLEVQVDDVLLGIDAAVPCGLMLNELISNALKHAFPQGQSGQIRVHLREDENQQVTLLVSDNGIGLPPDFDIQETDSLGMQLVDTLVDQLEGRLEIQSQPGTQFKVTFPIMAQD